MDITINAATKQQYLGNLDNLVRERASAYDAVPRWGTYVGNGPNDAWNKADAALKTWASLNPPFAKLGQFPRNDRGAAAALVALKQVEAAEARAGKAGAGDPLNVGFHGDPEQEVAQTHDFTLGVAAAAHDLRGQIAANNRFYVDSMNCAALAQITGNPVAAARDQAAAVFIGGPANGLSVSGPAGRAVAQGVGALDRAVGTKVDEVAEMAVRAERAPIAAAIGRTGVH